MLMLNIIPELGNLVAAGSYEAYEVDHKAPNRYLPLATGTYYSLVRLFNNFQQHLGPEADAKEAKDDMTLNEKLVDRKQEWGTTETSALMSRTKATLIKSQTPLGARAVHLRISHIVSNALT